jgi:hypothetical protein
VNAILPSAVSFSQSLIIPSIPTVARYCDESVARHRGPFICDGGEPPCPACVGIPLPVLAHEQTCSAGTSPSAWGFAKLSQPLRFSSWGVKRPPATSGRHNRRRFGRGGQMHLGKITCMECRSGHAAASMRRSGMAARAWLPTK